MASPVVSRSPSAHFAPGPHRRSHPNLQELDHLSLAPLTPKYPINPSDYDAYYDPTTSELHSSASLSQIAVLPSPGGILTNSPARSRNPSRSRKRKVKPNVQIQLPEDLQDSEPPQKVSTPKAKPQSQSQSHVQLSDPSWLVQTGLSLTESSRETKGQSWISKRDSSTSLANTPVDGYFEMKREGRTPRSGRATPARSRVVSRNGSRNASRTRLGLMMTTTDTQTTFATAMEGEDLIVEEEEYETNWADPKTQAEVAAHLAAELGEWDDDPYGMLDFERQGDSEAEEEVKKAFKSWRIGWLDGAVDALMLVEDIVEEEGAIYNHEEKKIADGEDEVADEDENDGQQQGGWMSANWMSRAVKKSVGLS